ncbi:MAG: TVP38/TMEM64 family protein [Candidatus Helarchaeota archaeon]
MSEEKSGNKILNWIKGLFDFREHDKKTKLIILLFLGLVVLSVVMLIYNYFIDESFLTNIVIKYIVIPIRQLGWIGIIIILGFMIIQGLLVPIPSELVLLAIGIVYGLLFGTVIGIIGSMGAAIVCFYISRRGGRPVVQNMIGESNLDMVESWLEDHGFATVLLGRMIPFIPFDVISYGGGIVGSIKWRDYLIATFLGSIVRALFYSFLGDSLLPFEKDWLVIIGPVPFIGPFYIDMVIGGIQGNFNMILLILLVGLGITYLVYQFILLPHLQKKTEQTA